MGINQSDDSSDAKRFASFKDQFADVGDRQDNRFGKFKMYESIVSQPGVGKEKVVAKLLEAGNKEEFNRVAQLIKRREQLRSPFLCKVYGAFDSSEDLICGSFHRMTYLYEYVNYDLDMDLVNRARLPNNHPDKVTFS